MRINFSTNRRPIRQLSAGVINKIAAGEVIERPASAIKELLENAADSGADRIEVAVENGGLDLMRVTDNGGGIPHDELLLAVTSHATSKIENADDLFCVGTFGFRGEALASIAEISEFTIKSKTPDQESAYELIVRGGRHEPIEPCGGPVGTTVTVENIFFNTPVRRKFMRTAQTEMGHIGEAFTRIALANPAIQLTLLHNGKVQYQLAPANDWAVRIKDFFGPEIGDALIPIESQFDQIRLSGFVVDPQVTRSHNRMQYLFLNGRYIRDRSLQHALTEAYRGLIMTQRFPVCFLNLEMPFESVDVNVHPAKLEVRFQDGGKIYSQLLATIRNKFLTSDLTARGNLGASNSGDPRATLPHSIPGMVAPPLPYPDSGRQFALRTPTVESQPRMDFSSSAPNRNWIDSPFQSQSANSSTSRKNVDPSAPWETSFDRNASDDRFTDRTDAVQTSTPTGPKFPRLEQTLPLPNRTLAMQVHDTYLITETEEGMVIIDQHALHERVLYEQLREKVFGGKLETQRLLVPEPVTLRPAEVSTVIERAATLSQMGILVEPFGGDTVLVSSYPAMLANHNPAEMLRSLVDKLMVDGSTLGPEDLLDELLHMIACKAAIKAGDRLSREEIQDLIAFRDLCRDAHHCPHGRPTALVFSREELDKKFKRI